MAFKLPIQLPKWGNKRKASAEEQEGLSTTVSSFETKDGFETQGEVLNTQDMSYVESAPTGGGSTGGGTGGSTGGALTQAPKDLPLIGRLPVRTQYIILGAGFALSAIAAVLVSMYSVDRTEQMTQRVAASAEIQMLSQRLAKNVQKAVAGSEEGFKEAAKDNKSMQEILNKLRKGSGSFDALEPAVANKVLPELENPWKESTDKMKVFLEGSEEIVFLAQSAEQLEQRFNSLKTQLDAAYVLMLQRGDMDSARVVALRSLNESLTKLARNLSTAATANRVDVRSAAAINADRLATIDVLDALLKGKANYSFKAVTDPEVKSILQQLSQDSAEYLTSAQKAGEIAKVLAEAKAAGSAVLPLFEKMYANVGPLKEVSEKELSTLEQYKMLVYLLIAISVLFMLTLAYANKKDTEKVAYYAKLEKEETDQAVINLMTELYPIAGGDLAARLTVTEHVTGSIADTINSTVEQLQGAMVQIKTSSAQTKELVDVIKNLSVETQAKVQEATDMAKESSDLSTHGAGLVQDASERMLEARDRIQEVAKRVKRLGEVSQSIGRVSAVIEDVTEKTAILALNTSLKAEESGEAGKPFRVIADEIRKLSDSTLKALNEISDSVQSIQSETNVVIRTVESVTSNVVEGAKLWDEATGALGLIKNTAGEIDKMVEDVNGFALKQVEATQKATELMGLLEESTDQFNTKKKQAFE